MRNESTTTEIPLTPAKRKRLLKRFGPSPAGYTTRDLEHLLDLLYGMYSFVYTLPELRQMTISNPFDRSESREPIALLEFTAWLEALVS